MATEAHDRQVPIRIGVNGGSLDPALYEKYGGRVTPEAMVESAQQEMAYFDEVGFDLIKISVKASSVPLMVEAYRQLADVTDHPLHLGVTEAGPLPNGLLKATAGIATLLLEGIGDTIRYSLTADPVEEARAGRTLLESLGLRERKNIDLIACPSCGRAEIDVIDVAKRAMEAFGDREIPLQVAVMGCVVNGPGEAREADIGIAAGNKRGHLFVRGRNVAVVPEDEMVPQLVEWAEFIHEHGVDAAIARADTARAEREAAKDRNALLGDAGRRRQPRRREDRRDPANHGRAGAGRGASGGGDERGGAGGDGELVARGEVAGAPGRGDDELVGRRLVLDRTVAAQQADRRVDEVQLGAGAITGSASGVGSATVRRSSTSTGFTVSPPRTTLSLAPISSIPLPTR